MSWSDDRFWWLMLSHRARALPAPLTYTYSASYELSSIKEGDMLFRNGNRMESVVTFML